MANWFIAIVYVVLTLLCFGVLGYLLVLWSHPDEKDANSLLVYKILVVRSTHQVLGFTGGIIQIALIPLDVANFRSDYGLSMYTAWLIVLICNVILMVLLVPYILFYYETDPEANVLTRVADSICSYVCFVMFFLAAWLIVHFIGNSYSVPLLHIVEDFRLALPSSKSLNSLGQLATDGSLPNARPGQDHAGSYSWNPFAWQAVDQSD